MFINIEKTRKGIYKSNFFLKKTNQLNHKTAQKILLFMLCVVPFYLKAASPEFGIVQIDDQSSAYSSMVTDRDNKIHVAYWGKTSGAGNTGTNCQLKYKTNASGTWKTTVLESDEWTQSCTFNNKPSIAVDSNRKPHVVYKFGLSVKYAGLDDSGNWRNVSIDEGRSPSIALSASGSPHITYLKYIHSADYQPNYGTLWLAIPREDLYSSSWDCKQVDKYAAGGNIVESMQAHISIDHADRIHIVYAYKSLVNNEDDNIKIRYARKSEGNWEFEDIKDGIYYNHDNEGISFAVDSNGTPYVLFNKLLSGYQGYKPALLKREVGNYIDWKPVEGFLPNESLISSMALTVDSANSVHISYAGSANQLSYMSNTTQQWETHRLAEFNIVFGTSIAVDQQHRLNISYDDTVNNSRNIKMATTVPDLVVTSLTTPETGGARRSIQIEDTTINQGGGRTPVTSTRYFLTKVAEKFPYQTLPRLFKKALEPSRPVEELGPNVDPNNSSHGSAIVTIPGNVPVGLYRITAMADGDNQVDEIEESNNYKTDYINNLIEIGPDLVPIVSVNQSGNTVSITVTTKNIGGGDAVGRGRNGIFKTKIKFDPPILNPVVITINQLAPGEKHEWSNQITLPGSLPRHFGIDVIVDIDNDVNETNENNNVFRVRH